MIFLLLAAQIEINAELDGKDINKVLTVGDPFEVVVTVSHPRGMEISMPYVDTLEPFMVIDQASQRIEEGGMIKNLYRYKLVSFDTGELELPSFRCLMQSDSLIDTLLSNRVNVKVASVLPSDMQEINDIKDAVRFPNFRPLIIGAIILLVAVLGYLAYHYVKKLRKARAIARPLPPSWVEAILALERIPVDEWLARGMIKRYYYSLSEILKRYLERRFEFKAVEQTTTEIVDNMRTLRIPQRDEFNRFFTGADLVKYAKYVPPGNEIASAIDTAKDLVNKTKPDDLTQEST
jgi:hypothetical protein